MAHRSTGYPKSTKHDVLDRKALQQLQRKAMEVPLRVAEVDLRFPACGSSMRRHAYGFSLLRTSAKRRNSVPVRLVEANDLVPVGHQSGHALQGSAARCGESVQVAIG
jgi:hypothetical protein